MAFERITTDPARMRGLPCIRGTRITVSAILGQLAAGRSVDGSLLAAGQSARPQAHTALADEPVGLRRSGSQPAQYLASPEQAGLGSTEVEPRERGGALVRGHVEAAGTEEVGESLGPGRRAKPLVPHLHVTIGQL
ncbi:MAG: DUF433 domain-containing protein, partial [Actinobacteria bacterium]|nr:DUF433 domain-containing protein [Actinomycetota bacterium]